MKHDLQKHTLHLYAGEYEELRDMFPDVGAAAVIRELVHGYLKQARSEAEMPDNISIQL